MRVLCHLNFVGKLAPSDTNYFLSSLLVRRWPSYCTCFKHLPMSDSERYSVYWKHATQQGRRFDSQSNVHVHCGNCDLLGSQTDSKCSCHPGSLAPCSSILDKLGVESVEFTNFAALALLSSTIHFSFKISRANKGFVCSITLSQVVSVLRVLRRYVTQSMRLRSPLLLQGFPLSVHRAFVEEEDCSRYMSQKEFADQCGATSIQRS